MKLVIDNNDGAGGLDYTAAILRDRPLTIRRQRGAWSRCECGLDAAGAHLPVPQRLGRVMVSDASGAVLFRGYLSADPEVLGTAAETLSVTALEEAWLTQPEPPDTLQPDSAVAHSLNAGDVETVIDGGGTPPASDVTVYGEHEAAGYVTELFRGDGTTQTFLLSHAPFRESRSGTLLAEQFDGAVLPPAAWKKTDPGSYLSLGAGGLRMAGGNGFDGATLLEFAQAVELGGTLVAQAAGVTLEPGSDGLLMGLYDGAVAEHSCVAGVRVHGASGAQTLKAVVNGVERGIPYTFAAGHTYTLRLRLHCAELQRRRATYRALVDGELLQFGGATVPAPLRMVLEVRDEGLASNTLATVLFDGAIAASPALARFVPVNSTQLSGSIGSVSLQQTGSAWVTTTAADGTWTTRREGVVGTGADYAMSAAGVLLFDPGRVPQPGELLTVQYRRTRRACARLRDATADQLRLQLALPGLPAWSGSVSEGGAGAAPRSSADCRAAAQALLALAQDSDAGQSGSMRWTCDTAQGADVQPGDTLALHDGAAVRRRTAHGVTVTDSNTDPERLLYRVEFHGSRTAKLSFHVSGHVPQDAPAVQDVPLADEASLPAVLSGLQVTSATGSALSVDAGLDAPIGGGFEVRRSDANFGSPATGDLVLDSPVRSFSIPRQAFAERFFVRMYDASTPPLYSPLSSLVLTSLPTG